MGLPLSHASCSGVVIPANSKNTGVTTPVELLKRGLLRSGRVTLRGGFLPGVAGHRGGIEFPPWIQALHRAVHNGGTR